MSDRNLCDTLSQGKTNNTGTGRNTHCLNVLLTATEPVYPMVEIFIKEVGIDLQCHIAILRTVAYQVLYFSERTGERSRYRSTISHPYRKNNCLLCLFLLMYQSQKQVSSLLYLFQPIGQGNRYQSTFFLSPWYWLKKQASIDKITCSTYPKNNRLMCKFI